MSEHIPQAELVFSIEAHCSTPEPLGARGGARMMMIPITGGTVSGPKLNGEIIPGGADWAVVYPSHAQVEARYAIRAEDGTVIQVFNAGAVPIGEQGERPALPLTTPRFIAPEGPHGWLNLGVFVATLDANPANMGVVRIGVFKLT
jgi:Protein of unknown function (DUF3237)